MSNSSGEKSEKPTTGKLSKARKKGDIPRSKDVTMAAGLVTSFILLSLFLPYYKELISQSFVSVSQLASQLNDQGALEQFLLANLFIFAKFLATLVPIPLFSMLATLIPGGWNFTPVKLIPDLKKLSPLAGIKRIFSASNGTEVLKMLAKCSIVLYTLYLVVHSSLDDLLHLQTLPLEEAITQGFAQYHHILLYFIAIVVVFAIIDIPLSHHLFTKKMKMTKQEVKQEHKNNDGNPEIKSRVRQLQRQYAIGQINKTVPSADVIITNPTHFSVALKYAPEKASAPYIVAKGKDDIALYIRSIAQKHKIEIVEFPPLARAIYHTTKVNQQIPAQLYRAIAQVLTYVMQIKSWRSGQASKPVLNTHLGLPKEMQRFHDET
ncbi:MULTISPECIES: flagellar biosynthesis protein FlhB [Yersinia pseudotuberculosis complex]|uniref:Flagellar biosynthetic protein FlhB n=1 Tax=Yersinia pseudotuberculosis serotype O:1b (strain IP 31758) TaxID=349747 RepID=A0A0U1QUH1_YERP3|nr:MULTISPECIES: flagellar biosynthesis protein FlhB [Yersinia pseudotuberculosis complex]ABS46083.1 flagellar biosynthetic protein FlhB [Yersinia pseudotuberculosis IP 31758]MCE4114402.1 flagellar type III secretion system protein FlhB [Yersinia pseudotuberculosis]MCF1164862.1 flagellar type III secretion system protein FlhB [Yersinia pseudotuberculosis]RYC20118.1 flagellar type III secretion system protein FlhB [Yersinia pseudotuberculosis]UFA60270.1 Flagellar biosynthesis protein FlhB [Yers